MLRWVRSEAFLTHHRASFSRRLFHGTPMPSCGGAPEQCMDPDDIRSVAYGGTRSESMQPASCPSLPIRAAGSGPTYYKRKLPTPPCIDFASDEGKQLCLEAMQAGHMNGFFKLIQHLSTQAEPAFCGVASLCVVFNAMEIDPRRVWKGAWRWFSEDMLDCCKPLDQDGITLDQLECLAKCNCTSPELYRYGTFTYSHFRDDVAAVTASGIEHIIATYSRRTLSQTGDGHFSPIGGFHPSRDLVLILDTARFKYPPHWVPLQLLYEAMEPLDWTTGQPRGYLKVCPLEKACLLLFKLSIRGDWRPAHDFAVGGCVAIAQEAIVQGASAEEVVKALIRQMPHSSAAALVLPRDLSVACNHAMGSAQQLALDEMQQVPLYSTVNAVLQDTLRVTMTNSISSAAGGASEKTIRSNLTVQQCFVLLCLCRRTLEMEAAKGTDLQDDDQAGSRKVLREVLQLLDNVKQSSLVANELDFLAVQLGTLPVIDGVGPPGTPVGAAALPECRCRSC